MGMYAVQTADTGDLAALREAARGGRAVAMSRRRAVAAGRSALGPESDRVRTGFREASLRGSAAPVDAPPPSVPDGPGTPTAAPVGTNVSSAVAAAAMVANGVAAAHIGRVLSVQRRRQLSQGKQALNGSGGAPGSSSVDVVDAAIANGVAAAHIGRVLSVQRRRQLSQGKQALNGSGGAPSAPAAAPAAPAPPAGESTPVDDGGSCHEQARARRTRASRLGSAATSRPDREGRLTHAPKVLVSPTHGGQGVTGLRIGPGVRVTGDEPGTALPVSGTQYVAADGSAPAPGAGRKVGLVRTPRGLVVSGTTVRNKVAITGDEFGEHLPITGEADQKLDDDLTPRRDGTYLSVQFPRRADPHGASAAGTRLGSPPAVVVSTESGSWSPLETSDGGLAVTGTAVGRSGRVTGNEAGACRPITGDQYQGLSSRSSECGGTGGGTAPAEHLNRARLDPATGGKVTVAQTWGGQRVTGPSVEHRPNVTGDEPGVCRPLTGTPYQGQASTFGWCEPDEGRSAALRLDPRPEGVGLTGDVPMDVQPVTGTERGARGAVTGTPYYRDLRAPEAAADDWAVVRGFPVAQARRLARREGDEAPQKTDDRPAPSAVPGGITGSFAVGDGKVTGNNEFLFRARPGREREQTVVTGEGATVGPNVTGSAWTRHDRVTGTEGYIAAGRNPSEGGSATHTWAGARKFRDRATPGGPHQNVTGLSGWSAKPAARVTVSGGAQG